MKKVFLLIIAVIVCGVASVYAQHDEEHFWPPDYRQISRNIQDPATSFYYPRLMQRFLAGDPTLSLQEGRHLYFGAVFQPWFTTADNPHYNQLLVSVLRRTTFTDQDYADILRFSQALLDEDPFNLRALESQLIVHAHYGNTVEYARIQQKRRVVLLAISSTSDGMSPDTPFFVTRMAHQFDILPFFGLHFGGEARVVRNRGILNIFSRNRRTVNYVTLTPNPFGIPRYYFDITPMMRRM